MGGAQRRPPALRPAPKSLLQTTQGCFEHLQLEPSPPDPPADSWSHPSYGKTNLCLFSFCVGPSMLFYQLLSGRRGLHFTGKTQNPPALPTGTHAHAHCVSPPLQHPPGTYYDLRAIFAQRLLESTDNAKGDSNSTIIGAVGACTAWTLSWSRSTGQSHHGFFTGNGIGPQTRIF